MDTPAVIRPRLRQQNLFPVTGPLTSRLGVAFFQTIPEQPGVYFFFDDASRLLYIGQSGRLRHRIGSYRFVSETRHARRTGRLVSRTARIEWKVCATPAEAVELESRLLRECRPPFNRAGVWEAPPWWLTLEGGPGHFRAILSREESESGTGPLPSSFRGVYPSLLRCVYRWLHPEVPLWDFPPGMTGALIPPGQEWAIQGDGAFVAGLVKPFLVNGTSAFLEALEPVVAGSGQPSAWALFWQEEMETLRKFALKRQRMTVPSASGKELGA
ncbi:MAG TPA: nucleotide excision repair endonuclease [Verrucomicrobiales bacterium]|nr:nucleotide excision repair endonuclease [Verrucomicrobiales bacterium]